MFRRMLLAISLAFVLLLAGSAMEAIVPRLSPLPDAIEGQKISLNGEWYFHSSPGNGFNGDGNVNHWKTIQVPGEWVMQGFEVEKGEAAGYVREFTLPASWKGQRVKLRCNAVYSDCKVFVNGKKAGSHLGGFTAFELDVTHLVTYGGTNRIALSVVSESIADATSNASFYAVHPLGGITRDIYLFALPEVNLSMFHVATSFDSTYTD
ncbi:MAG: glycoside hydrolase family 2, partial [Phocaeicola sp.]|nr:glycoside hydrolase family 2 [Phocaeicola sp.]